MLNCVITDTNIRIFGNAIAALARIGHDLTFDVSANSVCLTKNKTTGKKKMRDLYFVI